MTLKVCGLHEDAVECEQDENCSSHTSCVQPCEDACPLLQDKIEKQREIKVELNGVVKCYDVCMLHKSMELMGPRDPITREDYSDRQREFISKRASVVCPSDNEPRVSVQIQNLVHSVLAMFKQIAEESHTSEDLQFHMSLHSITREKLEMAFTHHVVKVGSFRPNLADDINHFAITYDEIETIFYIVSRLVRSTTLFYQYLTRTTFPVCVERAEKKVNRHIRFTLGEFKKHRSVPTRLQAWVQQHQPPLLDYFCSMTDASEMFIRPDRAMEYCIAVIADHILSITLERDSVPGIRFLGTYTKEMIVDDAIIVRRATTYL